MTEILAHLFHRQIVMKTSKRIRKHSSNRVRKLPRQKKTPNGYILYCNLYRNILKHDFPHFTQQELVREMGRRWNLSPNHFKNLFLIYSHEQTKFYELNSMMNKFHYFDQYYPPGSPPYNNIDDDLFNQYINYPPGSP